MAVIDDDQFFTEEDRIDLQRLFPSDGYFRKISEINKRHVKEALRLRGCVVCGHKNSACDRWDCPYLSK